MKKEPEIGAYLRILTPTIGGKDGISTVARSIVRAFHRCPNLACPTEVWSLVDEPEPVFKAQTAPIAYRSAGGRAWSFAGWGIRAGLERRAGTAFVVHRRYAPVALPMVARGARLILFLHGVEVWQPFSFLERVAARRATLAANSHYTVARFRQANPSLADQPVQVCHLGIPPSPHSPTRPLTPEPGALVVGRLASADRYKGHDQLLEIWPQVVEQAPDAVLWVVGDGDDRPRLQEKAAALGLTGRVRFWGKVSDAELARLYQDCVFFVMPSQGEGFGLVFIEAMQAGKACIGGHGAADEIIEDGVTGLLVDSSQHKEILAAVLRLYQDPATRTQMGCAGAQRLAHLFTEDLFHERLLRLVGLSPAWNQ